MKRLGSSDIAALLRREITKGSYRLNDRLPSSREMASHYKVARNTLLDALAQLETEGLLARRAGSGTYVTYQPSISSTTAIESANPLELIDTRFALEPHICRLCVMHGMRGDFDRLEALCDEMEQSINDPVRFAEADGQFHKKLAETTKNGLLIWIIEQITEVRAQDDWTRMRHLTLEQYIIAKYNTQHRQILNAIRSREPERAANLMKEHLETARLSLTRAAET